jgi:hypothetical protein
MFMPAEIARPTFIVEQSVDLLEFAVVIGWPGRDEVRIGPFGSPTDARRWIERESLDWLRARL